MSASCGKPHSDRCRHKGRFLTHSWKTARGTTSIVKVMSACRSPHRRLAGMGSRQCSGCGHTFFAHGPHGCGECGCTDTRGGFFPLDTPPERILQAIRGHRSYEPRHEGEGSGVTTQGAARGDPPERLALRSAANPQRLRYIGVVEGHRSGVATDPRRSRAASVRAVREGSKTCCVMRAVV